MPKGFNGHNMGKELLPGKAEGGYSTEDGGRRATSTVIIIVVSVVHLDDAAAEYLPDKMLASTQNKWPRRLSAASVPRVIRRTYTL